MTCDVLLLHVPRPEELKPRIMLMPMGLVGLASFLTQHHIACNVLHLGIERYHDPEFSLTTRIAQLQPKVVGLTIAFQQQAAATIATAALIKSHFPAIKIILGGFTASRFAEEIIEHFSIIDFVIQGDAEVPLQMLFYQIAGSTALLSDVPNLVWRGPSGAVTNAPRFQLSAERAREINLVDFTNVFHGEDVLRLRMDHHAPDDEQTLYLSPGRGCNATCCYCAGARSSQAKYQNRPNTVFFPVDHVADQLVQIHSKGVKRWSNCFDPDPAQKYYINLFAELRNRGFGSNKQMACIFDCFGLPDAEFILSFKDTFSAESVLNISPETGSEPLRRKMRTFYYNNTQLWNTLAFIEDQQMRCSLYFAVGLPHGDAEEFHQTLGLIDQIRLRFPHIWIHVGIIDIEPGSMLFDRPEPLGIHTKIHDFRSLLDAQNSHPSELNYHTNQFSSEQIVGHRDVLMIASGCTEPTSPLAADSNAIAIARSDSPLRQARHHCAHCPHVLRCFGQVEPSLASGTKP